MKPPCPCCDIEKHNLSPFSSLAFGVALGEALAGQGGIIDKVCKVHRVAYVLSMAKAAQALCGLEAEECS